MRTKLNGSFLRIPVAFVENSEFEHDHVFVGENQKKNSDYQESSGNEFVSKRDLERDWNRYDGDLF
ncbi:hypothetical protein DQM68_09555 [Leptospira mayottensis]|uniref:Uncharacterized protein n=2 Tax=Leptospira mayottensis TaxID=1137606 RepID=A0AA87MMG1_9LEPT|nr:hypothetical protein DQM68_09555 [Leptospira mayottensis]AXR64764.1 hypothetical protein DQM28_11595 [Leptospira mayottensis]AZQ02675.1 hypothetical protein LEP1GSC190_12140 [Leptospira mayottensis 200901116]EKR98885.1 hypothetical protein LEP1GSC125_2361 [Leptospira mayottensis 200901122]TGN13085.1 hypothetical protein EHR03_05945 [Leptospira mayottensis]